ncbi:MAG: KamA family radical SAM protein, partial [Nitrospinota bacterium]
MNLKYKAYTLKNYKEIPQVNNLSKEDQFAVDVVGAVFPFKTNNYVVNELIDWENFKTDPMFVLHFPQKGMMDDEHFEEISLLIKRGASKLEIKAAANKIRSQLNPHPAGQLEENSPFIDGKRHSGMQHKYRETVLFFPSQGQTCHAYCTFCFRWPQFVGIDELRFASKDIETLISYLFKHREITDVLLTGGDPLTMKTKFLEFYINRILESDLPHVRTIRIGTKALAHWPQRFFSEDDSEEMLALFRKVVESGRHLAVMAHFNHQRELGTESAVRAIKLIRDTGAEIRTQSPLLRHINDKSEIWA